jgi:SAM-dependent methyltransferase
MSSISAGEGDLRGPGESAGPMNFLLRDRCPCCGTPIGAARVKAASSPPAESLSEAEHGRFLSGYTSKRVFFTYLECETCTGLFCPIYYDQEQLSRLYAHQAENMAEAPLEARGRTQRGYAELLMRHVRGGGGFLEIGADIGLFAQACAELDDFERFWLYEPNLDVHAELKSRFAGRSAVVRSDIFSSSHLPAGSVSAAAMIHVLDHLLDPVAALVELREVMEPGGALLIVTHDAQSLLARGLGRRWPPFTLQHPHLFSPASMRRLLASAGFECLEIAKTTNYFPATHFARAALSILGLRPDVIPAWQKPLVGLRLGNIGAVARRPK